MTHYLVFGDLHGRILPAFALARAWQRDHGTRLAALLQVGDLGYFPDPARMDKATKSHARRDSLELGAQQVVFPSTDADHIFADPDTPGTLYFIAGNHEDFELLQERAGLPGSTDEDFPVDHYGRVRCVVNGRVVTFADGLRVGGLWGIAGSGRKRHEGAYIVPRRARELAMNPLDILLSHDSAFGVVHEDEGSNEITRILEGARPLFHFFGHYHAHNRPDGTAVGATRAFHLEGLEFRREGGSADVRSVGLLRWDNGNSEFEYLDARWLQKFTRHNWRWFAK